ncbi:DUF4097 family beta strand repeat-containing protein [Hymenobacter persicinus]|uniref:Adhesin domain-containing protein n=1 Tax=Hymenobacter persicinus TaxID=2025506 RepID=A0A4Q5LBK6_9BACT|nr:hypothetical protein [Hymenobacter persicinus]RYU79767.1 hypothetical protein EWM57_10175 [Hymenobacter persicinus]
MKLTPIFGLIWLLLWLPSLSLQAQDREDKEQIKREFALTGEAGRSTLALYNIFGSITVEGYNGKTVVVEATKTIRADNAEQLALGKKEAQLGFIQRNDSVVVYQQGPQDSRPRRNNSYNSGDIDYRYQFDFVVKVPASMRVIVSTVNGGQVLVQDVSGPLQARNINGDVTLRNVREATQAHTINGDVSVSYAAAPSQASSYKTINGNITVSYPTSVSADVYFKSMHGELYTDFPKTEVLPARVTQNQQRDGQGTKYKLSKETAVRLGKGGPDFRFETLNGDVTIKQQTK